MKFKKGDTLKIIDVEPFETIYNYNKGDLFEALLDSCDCGLVEVRHLRSGRELSLDTSRFVQFPFRVGDRVMIVDSGKQATVKGIPGNAEGYLTLEFDDNVLGHNANGVTKPGQDLYIRYEYVVPITSHRQETSEYAHWDWVGLELKPIKVIYNGPATILFYEDPITGEEKRIVAMCHPDDTYDKELGKRVAILKALHKEIPRIIAYETARL